MANKDGRRTLYLERKYARELRRAIKAQMIAFHETGKVGDELETALRGMYDAELRWWLSHEYAQIDGRIKADDFFLPGWRRWIDDFVNSFIGAKITKINNTTRDMVRGIVEAGAAQGWTLERITSEVQDVAGSLATYHRAFAIARTELGNAINAAKTRSSDDFEFETGVKMGKLWIHRGAKEPRDAHLRADNGEAIPKEAMFIIDGEPMMYPHDPGASAENVINCGCQVVYVRLKDE